MINRDILKNTDISKIRNPYRAEVSKQFSGWDIIFDDSTIFNIPYSLGITFAIKITAALNGAFFEGYFERERA